MKKTHEKQPHYENYSPPCRLSNSVELRKKTTAMVEKTASLDINGGRRRRDMTTEDLLHEMDQYGSTPPRQRTRNKTRDWDRKQKL